MNSDRTDPLKCLPLLPRLQRIQPSRPHSGGRSGCCCMSNEKRWGQMNGRMIEALAKMVNQSAGRVCQFLHQLTMQLFARILYPLMAGWNTLKIPFSQPDTCELYYGIFDECGNIRCPMPTRTLLILISMMQYFLNLPKPGCKRRDKCPSCKSKDSLKDIHNPGYCRNGRLFSGPRTPRSQPSPGKEIWDGLRRLGYDKYGANLESFPSDENIPYGYAPHGCPCQGRRSQASTGARQPSPSPYAHLSDPRALECACEQELRHPMIAPDCRQSSPEERMSPEQVERYYITHISDLYTAVVQNQHSRQLLGMGKPLKQRVIPCQEKRRSAGGFMVVPQPYFNGMPWSWLHRDPRRMMSLPSAGKQEMTPYRRQPMKEEYQGLQPIEYSPRDNTLKAMEPYRSPPNMEPQKRVLFTWTKRPLTLENLSRSIYGYPRELSGTEECKMQWEDKMLVKVNEARQIKSPLDYWKQVKERNQVTIIQSPWSISRPLSPIPREPNYSFPQVEISPYKIETTKTLKTATEQKSLNNSLESVKPNSNRKLLIIGTCHRRILSSQKTNADIEQQKEITENRLEQSNKASYTKLQSLGGNEEDTTENPSYPDPEEYREKTSNEHSKKKRHARKIAGESLFFITPAYVIMSKPDIRKPNEVRLRPGDTLGKPDIGKPNDVRLRPITQSSGRLIPTDSEKLKIKTRHQDKPELKKISLAENVKQMKLALHTEKVRITERKTHFQSEITKTESLKNKFSEQLLRFSNVNIPEGSTKSLPRSSESQEINPRSKSSLRRKSTEVEIPRKNPRQRLL